MCSIEDDHARGRPVVLRTERLEQEAIRNKSKRRVKVVKAG
jgi:hypothetical protein